jgi:hypothetical protein
MNKTILLFLGFFDHVCKKGDKGMLVASRTACHWVELVLSPGTGCLQVQIMGPNLTVTVATLLYGASFCCYFCTRFNFSF